MSHKKPIPCDKKGRPITPSDTSWQNALTKAVIFLVCGAVLLPVGFLLYNFVPLGENMGAVLFLFSVIIFLGSLFLLYGILILVIALVQRRKTPPEDKIRNAVFEQGETCEATITEVRTKKLRFGQSSEPRYRYVLEYNDEPYKYKRRFVTAYVSRAARIGDKLTVHYFPDSNINYYVETD